MKANGGTTTYKLSQQLSETKGRIAMICQFVVDRFIARWTQIESRNHQPQDSFMCQPQVITQNIEEKSMKIGFDFWVIWMLLPIFLAVQSPSNVLAKDEDAAAHRTAIAIRITGVPPQVDGVLDDEIWKKAPLHEGFRQREPDEAKSASERITFQIAYDDEALYFGVMCYDSEPDKIVSRLVRRDTDIESDRVTVSLAPHQNRVRGFWFTVYSSGSVTDGTVTDEYNPPFDNTWDGVWGCETPDSRQWLDSRV